MSTLTIKTASSSNEKLDWLEVVRRQVGSLSYGVVQIVVHDSQVTQIEKTERVRLDKPQKI
ncbi:MAG: YezD family protein [Limisphaerales bacterium]